MLNNSSEALKLWKKLGLPGKPVSLGGGLYGLVCTITPAWFTMVLAKFNRRNRKMKAMTIEKYARNMTNGSWRLTHEGLAFSDSITSPALMDGQNRGQAIVKSGKTQEMLVVIGVLEENADGINECVSRNARDVIDILQHDIEKKLLPICRNVYLGYDRLTMPISNAEGIQVAEDFGSAVEWVFENFHPEGYRTSSAVVYGALARAYLYVKGDNKKVHVLKTFLQVLGDGQYKGLDDFYQNAVRLRDAISRKKWYGQAKKFWGVSEYALFQTFQGKKVARLRVIPEELFPLPHDEMFWQSKKPDAA